METEQRYVRHSRREAYEQAKAALLAKTREIVHSERPAEQKIGEIEPIVEALSSVDHNMIKEKDEK